MIISDIKTFKENLSDKAYQYVVKLVGGEKQQEQQNFIKASKQHLVVARSFDDAELDFTRFNWHTPDRDRNWWWQMQALPFLGWFNSSYKLFSFEQQKEAISFCIESLITWQENAASTETSPLVWHDHATAFRLRNLVNWLLICFDNNHFEQLQAAETKINFMQLLEQHLTWLADDANYSKFTNHGFDQALVVYSAALYLKSKSWQKHAKQASIRLKQELEFAFTEEGVHKENSPGYHKFMLGRVKTLIGLKHLGERKISGLAAAYVDKATAFLKAITLPDGNLPIIGDTRGGEEGIKEPITNELTVYDYCKSGYVIVKGLTTQHKEFCLIFKNAHDSHYHRHDDDLSIFLYYDGRVILGDGGLGSHNEKDPRRIFLRSAKSHNVPYIVDVDPNRSPNKRIKKNTITINDSFIEGRSYCYGFEIKRIVNISNICNGIISILDSFLDSKGMFSAVNYYSPCQLQIGKDLFSEFPDGVYFKIDMQGYDDFKMYSNDDAVVSTNYNDYSKAHSYGWIAASDKLITTIKFGDRSYE